MPQLPGKQNAVISVSLEMRLGHVIWPAILGRSRCSTSSAGRDVEASGPRTSWVTGNISCQAAPIPNPEYPGLSPKRNTIKGVHVAHHRASTATGGCKVAL